MVKNINPIPKGYRSANPALVVRNADAAIRYYTSVFGAEEISRIVAEDGLTILRAEIKIGNSILQLSDEMPAVGILSPLSLGGSSNSVQLYLGDLDDAWERAVESGATVILQLEDTYWGERTGRIVDMFGHVWTLSKRVEAVGKAELEKRIKAMAGAADIETPVEDIPTVDIRSIDLVQNVNDALVEQPVH